MGGNFANNVLKDFTATPELPYSGFNTPQNRFNVNFGKRAGSGEKFGFNIALKHQQGFIWQSSFDQNEVGRLLSGPVQPKPIGIPVRVAGQPGACA